MRQVSAALQSIVDLDWLQSYLTLEIRFPDGQVLRWAGSEVQITGEAPYRRGVIRSNGLRQSLGTAVDLVDITVENTDWSHSRRLMLSSAEILSPAIVGRLHRDYRNEGAWVWRALLRGVVGSPVTNEGEATYRVISDLAAAGKVGATRLVNRSCQWRYKGSECSYSGPLATCDFTFAASSGCSGRGVQHRYGGFLYDTDKLSLILPPPNTGGGGGIGGGGNEGPDDYNPYKDGPLPVGY